MPILVILSLGCSGTRDDNAAVQPRPVAMANPVTIDDLSSSVGEPVTLDARDLVVQTGGVELKVPYLQARLIPNGDYVDLGRPTSFTVTVEALELRIPEQSLNVAFAGGGDAPSPFATLHLRTENAELVLDGTTRALHLPFTLRATPRVTGQGDLSFDLEQVRLLGVGVKGFLGAFDKPIEDAVNDRQRMINVEKDYLVLHPFPFLGPPRIRARFSSVSIEKTALVARLGDAPKETDQPAGIRIAGGAFRSEGTLFFDSTLTLVPQEGKTLRIDPDRFDAQQEAGFAKLGPGRSVVLYVAPPEAATASGGARTP